MKVDLNLKDNKMIIDFENQEELEDFIENLEKLGYKVRDYKRYYFEKDKNKSGGGK